MANTIIHPKPAHLAGDSSKFHSKLVGGKAKKMKKSMKKTMKGKKGKKPMRKTMKKKTGGSCSKRILKKLGLKVGTSYKDCLRERLKTISDDFHKIIVDSLKEKKNKNWWMRKLREQYGNEYNSDTTCTKFSFGKSTMHKFYDNNIGKYKNTIKDMKEINDLRNELQNIQNQLPNNTEKNIKIEQPDKYDKGKENLIENLKEEFEDMNIRSNYEEQIIAKLQDFCTGYDI
jgi:hypothetical protein